MRQVVIFGTTTTTAATVSVNDAISIPSNATMCAADKNRGLEVYSLPSTSSFELTTSASVLETAQQQPQRVTATHSAGFLKCDRMWVEHPWFVVFLALLTWYCSSLGITALNKYLFDTLQFNYPLLVTFVHFTSVAAFLYISFFLCPKFAGDAPACSLLTTVSWRHIVPISVLGATEIALSNLAYPEVSISVMTVIKSSLVVVTYLLSVFMGLEKFCWRLLGLVVFIFLSICITVPGMDVKRAIGVWFLVGAVLAAGMRWVLVHEQLQVRQYTPIQLMFLTQPLCALSLAAPASAIDLLRLLQQHRDTGVGPPHLGKAVILVSIAVVLAFLVVFAEFQLVRITSSLSLTVAGVGKEAATILMSMILFHERVNPKTAVGIGASILGIISYSHLRFKLSTDVVDYVPAPTGFDATAEPSKHAHVPDPTCRLACGELQGIDDSGGSVGEEKFSSICIQPADPRAIELSDITSHQTERIDTLGAFLTSVVHDNQCTILPVVPACAVANVQNVVDKAAPC